MRKTLRGICISLLTLLIIGQTGDEVYAVAEVPVVENRDQENAKGVPMDTEHFPDEQFRHFLRYLDLDRDGFMTEEELAQNKELSCEEYGIQDLTGIEYFTELERLDCSKNKLTFLDLTKNKKLEHLTCEDNQITTLTLPEKSKLTTINCDDNRLTTLRVNNAINIYSLWCANNQLTTIDFGDTPYIRWIRVENNKLATFSPVKCRELSCDQNEIAKLDITQCGKALKRMSCSENNLKSLDASKNPDLKSLTCSRNQLTNLDLTNKKNLEWVECSNNQLSSLNLSGIKEIRYVNCSYNQLKELDLSGISKITDLNCSHNQITELDLSKKDMYILYCNDNLLSSLEIGPIHELFCGNNPMKTLDLSGADGLSETDDLSAYQVKYAHTPKLTGIAETKKGIRLTWNYPKNRCDGFCIYRKEKGGSWKKIRTIKKKQSKSTGKHSYEDRSVTKKKSYTYTVRAFRNIYREDEMNTKNHLGGYNKKGLTLKYKGMM